MNRLVARTYAFVLLGLALATLILQGLSTAIRQVQLDRDVEYRVEPAFHRLTEAIETSGDPALVMGIAATIVGPSVAILPAETVPFTSDQRRRLDADEIVERQDDEGRFVYARMGEAEVLEMQILGPRIDLLQTALQGSPTSLLAPDPEMIWPLEHLSPTQRHRVQWRPIVVREGLFGVRYRVLTQLPMGPGVITTPSTVDVDRLGRILWPVASILFAALSVVLALRPLRRELHSLSDRLQAIAAGRLEGRPARTAHLTGVSEDVDVMAARIAGVIQEQEELFQSVAHELRTPIARMLFSLDVLDDPSSPDWRPTLDQMRRTTQEMSALTDELLAFARLSDASPKLDRQECDLVELLEDLDARWPKLTVHYPEDEVLLSLDSRLVFRALDNLASNAERYAEHAEVTVTVGPEDVRVVVDDDGPGIPEALRARIFRPFVRAEASRSRATGGTGLGLAIVERVMERHGGTVVLGDSPQGGARFVLSFPSDGRLGWPETGA